jgi:hypothetical protein
MKITSRYEHLYMRAAEIGLASRSPRIQRIQQGGTTCDVCLGVTDPERTEYVFVGLNRGGKCTGGVLPETELNMVEYVAQPHRYQKRVGNIIEAFAAGRSTEVTRIMPLFGAVNLSFYHGAIEHGSFDIEVVESLPVILEELALPRLKALIFTGRELERYFYLLLWKAASAIVEMPAGTVEGLRQADAAASAFRTTIATGQSVICVFTKHLSQRGRGLPAGFEKQLGLALAQAI